MSYTSVLFTFPAERSAPERTRKRESFSPFSRQPSNLVIAQRNRRRKRLEINFPFAERRGFKRNRVTSTSKYFLNTRQLLSWIFLSRISSGSYPRAPWNPFEKQTEKNSRAKLLIRVSRKIFQKDTCDVQRQAQNKKLFFSSLKKSEKKDSVSDEDRLKDNVKFRLN